MPCCFNTAHPNGERGPSQHLIDAIQSTVRQLQASFVATEIKTDFAELQINVRIERRAACFVCKRHLPRQKELKPTNTRRTSEDLRRTPPAAMAGSPTMVNNDRTARRVFIVFSTNQTFPYVAQAARCASGPQLRRSGARFPKQTVNAKSGLKRFIRFGSG